MVQNFELKNAIQYNEPIWKIWKHKRYIISILAFMGYMNIYALRTNINIGIVDMTAYKNISLEDGTTILKQEFNWDSTIRGYVLSSYFYGFILTQILGGYLAPVLGGATVFGFGIGVASFFTLITPWIAKSNVYLLILIRSILGAFGGVTHSALQEVWSNWAPPSEKNRLYSISLSGDFIGAVLSMPICSVIATVYDWETIFYAFGAFGLIWCLVWMIVVRDTPSKDSQINQKELIYITEGIKTVKSNSKAKVPWLKILTSPAVIANIICTVCEGWGYYTMMTFLPQIMLSLLGFDLTESGILSGLPYLITGINVQMSGYIADFLFNRNYMTLTNIRKSLIIFGFLGQAVFILIAGYWISSIGISICLIIGVGLGGIALSSSLTNPSDIAPKFASVIFGISMTFSAIPGIVSPILTGYLVTDPTNVEQWRIVFFITSGLYFIGVIVTFFFVSGARQPWAEIDSNIINNLNSTNCG